MDFETYVSFRYFCNIRSKQIGNLYKTRWNIIKNDGQHDDFRNANSNSRYRPGILKYLGFAY